MAAICDRVSRRRCLAIAATVFIVSRRYRMRKRYRALAATCRDEVAAESWQRHEGDLSVHLRAEEVGRCDAITKRSTSLSTVSSAARLDRFVLTTERAQHYRRLHSRGNFRTAPPCIELGSEQWNRVAH